MFKANGSEARLYAKDIQVKEGVERNKAIDIIIAFGGEKDIAGKWYVLEKDYKLRYTSPGKRFVGKGGKMVHVNLDKVLDKIREYFGNEQASFKLVKRDDRQNWCLRLNGASVKKVDTVISLGTKEKALAKEIESEIRARFRQTAIDGIVPIKTESFMYDWLGKQENVLAITTYKRYRAVLDKVVKVLPEEIHLTKSIHIEEYKEQLQCEGYRPASVILELDVLKRIFEKAEKKNHIKKNPVLGVKKPKREKPKVEQYTEEELGLIFEELERRTKSGLRDQCPKAWAVYNEIFHCMNNSGLRVSDAKSLMWEYVDLDESMILVPEQKKTGKPAVIRIPTEYKQRLEKWSKGKMRKGLVFPNTEGNEVLYCRMDSAIRLVLKSCGITKKSPNHSFRHTVAMRLVRAIPIHEVAYQLGDSIETVIEYYVKPQIPTLESIDKAFQNGNGKKKNSDEKADTATTGETTEVDADSKVAFGNVMDDANHIENKTDENDGD